MSRKKRFSGGGTGAFFAYGRFITLYNFRDDQEKLWKNVESKMEDSLSLMNKKGTKLFLSIKG